MQVGGVLVGVIIRAIEIRFERILCISSSLIHITTVVLVADENQASYHRTCSAIVSVPILRITGGIEFLRCVDRTEELRIPAHGFVAVPNSARGPQ